MSIELHDIAERVNQTTIKLAINLSRVSVLSPGDKVQHNGDEDTEVYVVCRYGDRASVDAYSVNGDRLILEVENYRDD